MKKINFVCIFAMIALILASCNMPLSVAGSGDGQGADIQAMVDRAVAETMAAETQKSAPPEGDNPPADAPDSGQFDPTVTLNTMNEPPRVSVSVDTNCRSGPGSAYNAVGALLVGQIADVVGRSSASDNWVIRLPSNPTITCWVWGQYATVTGNTSSLPIIEPPPLPTLTPSSTITLPPPAANPTLTIVNNSSTTIFYVYFSLSSSSSWGDDRLGSSTIDPGTSFSWTIPAGVYDIKIEEFGHNVLRSWFSVSINSNVTLAYP